VEGSDSFNSLSAISQFLSSALCAGAQTANLLSCRLAAVVLWTNPSATDFVEAMKTATTIGRNMAATQTATIRSCRKFSICRARKTKRKFGFRH
jgi:hypothetical protein